MQQRVPLPAPDHLNRAPASLPENASSSWMLFPLPRTGAQLIVAKSTATLLQQLRHLPRSDRLDADYLVALVAASVLATGVDGDVARVLRRAQPGVTGVEEQQ